MHIRLRRASQLNPEDDDCSLGNELIDLLSFHESKSFPLAAEEGFEVRIGVGVYIVLLEDCKSCILDDGVAE